MNDLLIIFLVLLVLLTLISTMGGSIYSKEKFVEEEEEVSEPFWQEEDPVEHPKDVDTAVPEFSPIETFEEEAETQQEPSQSVEGEIVEGFDGDMYAAY
jgi:hypothetical protein